MVASLWIPAFAGMTGELIGGGGAAIVPNYVNLPL